MKRALMALVIVSLVGFIGAGKTDIFDSIVVGGTATFTGTMGFTGTAITYSPTSSFAAYSPSIWLGYDAGARLAIAVTDATGVTAITQAGSGPTTSWTVPVWSFTNSTSNTTYTPSWVLGFDAGSSMTVAVADTSGFATISHTGNATGFSWTATTGGFTCATSLTALTPSFVVGFDAGSSVAFGVADTSGALTVSHTGNATALSWTAATATWTNVTSSTTYTPSWVLGFDSGSSVTAAVADTTGALTVSHTGNAQALSWTVPTATWTHATSDTIYTPSFVVGYDAGSSLTFAVADTSGAVTVSQAGNATSLGWTVATASFTSATSFSALSPSIVLGFDVGAALTLAVADTTGVASITQAGNAPTFAWTVPVWEATNSTSNTTYTPSFVVGYDTGSKLTFAVADTTGAVTITHAGNATAVTWTATNFDFVGAMAADAITVSDVLTFSDAGTIDNTAADTLTITETKIALTGNTTVTGTSTVTVPTRYDYLLGSVPVDWSAAATTALYTVPAGKSCVITKIVIRSATISLDQATDATSNIGFDAATDLVASADISKVLVATTTWANLTLATPGVIGTTTQVLNLHNTVGCTTAGSTSQVDVFGYLF